MYMGLNDLPFGNIRAGQYKEPYGLEQITSSNNITFMERSLMNAFVPAFNAGLMLFDRPQSERFTWAVGAFRTGTDNGEVSKGDGEYAVTGRLTVLPYYRDEGRDLVHLGVGASLRSPVDDQVTFSSKPEANLLPAYVDVVNLAAEDLQLVGGEAAWVRGPFSLQGEYTLASTEAPSGGGSDADFDGYYVQASWFLTGESRPYKKTAGAFDAVKPERNAFGKEGGWGAWELAARYSSIDLTDGTIDEGQIDDVTFGVNWYLNPNTRVMMNYILANLEPAGGGEEGDTDILQFRMQFAF
jgi:phosphate-selective porin OprO/OprP